MPQEWLGRRIFIGFDGVFRDSRLWINGQYVDRHASGYTGFRYDLTDNLYYGKKTSLHCVRMPMKRKAGGMKGPASTVMHG